MRRVVDEELTKGMAYAQLARLMKMRGFPVSDATISSHDKHRHEYALPEAANTRTAKRDAAAIIKNRLLDAIEAQDASVDGLDILNKDLQPALKTALSAQNIEDKREAQRKQHSTVEVLTALLGALRGEGAPPLQLDDGMTVEGEAVEVETA